MGCLTATIGNPVAIECTDRTPDAVEHFRLDLADAFQRPWVVSVEDHLTAATEGKEHLHSLACLACYGRHLVARLTLDRGLQSLLVGSRLPGDLYPFEDLAVYYGLITSEDLHAMIIGEPGADDFAPPVPMASAIRFLREHADELDRDFAPSANELRDHLREIADSFRAAWDDAVGDAPARP